MGKIAQGIFGGSKSSQSSSNQAYPYLQNAYAGSVSNGTGANNALAALLGLGGDTDGQNSAFQNFRNSSGYQARLQGGADAITGAAGAKGLLRSGATGKALTNYGQQQASGSFNDYMSQLLGLSGQGLQAGSVISGAGTKSQGSSSSKPGIGGFLGSLAGGAAASDPRLKENIVPLYVLDNGLTAYTYNYIGSDKLYQGVMADEVAEKMPEALGPLVDGFMTVDYSKINMEAHNGQSVN